MAGTESRRSFRVDDTRRHLIVALLALCAVGILTVGAVIEMFKISGQTANYQAALENSIEQRSQVRKSFLLILEAEASQRGYLLTGDSAYLALFAQYAQEMPEELAELETNFSASEAQLERSRQLADLAEKRLEQLSAVLEEYRRDQRSRPLIHADRTENALRTMMALRNLADEMISFEEAEIRTAAEQVDVQSRWSRTVMLILLASIVVLVSAVLGLGVLYLSHRERIEAQLREARQLAEQTSRAKTEFLASMSHEIRTPLTGILGYTELLLEERLSARQKGFAQRLRLAGKSLLELVNDILDFSKIEAGEIALATEPLSIGALTGDVLSIISFEAKKKNIELRKSIDPNLPEYVAGDPMRLRQILLNLLNNAVKFTHEGSVTLTVRRVETTTGDPRIRFEITDTGIGIPRGKQDLLFRRFSQLDSSIQRQFGGTGLGLAISKALTELMGGEIGVESEPGQGSTFWVVLPLPEVEERDAEISGEREAAPASSGRVLLAEDLPQNQELVRTMLTRAGLEVDVATNGEEALAAVREAHYDLVLMDMHMPQMDGLEATRRIRAIEGPMRNVPIVAMTANVLPEHLEQFSKAGADGHIGKPFRKAELIETVDLWLSLGEAENRRRPRASEVTKPYEPAVLEEARELMGDQWIQACLTRLRAELGDLLGAGSIDSANPAMLKRHAHQIVADAGQLGFVELSRRCRDLEDACTRGRDVDLALEGAQVAARLATKTIDGMLPDRGAA